MKNKIKTGVVIVNYRVSDLVIKNLSALTDEADGIHIYVIDNNSMDGSVEKINQFIIENSLNGMITLINSEINGGFAYGCNLGITKLSSDYDYDYVWFLNPDAIPLKNAARELEDFLAKNSLVGIAGSQLENTDGSVRHAKFRFHSFLTELSEAFSSSFINKIIKVENSYSHSTDSLPSPVEWVSGASMMIRKEVIEQVGGLDQGYFLYYEEMDYCLKCKKNGWSTWHVPTSRVLHFAGSSTGVNSNIQQEQRRPKYWFESRRRYFTKNYGFAYTAITDIVWIIGYLSWLLRKVIQKKSARYPKSFLLDFMKSSVLLKWHQ